MFLFIIPILVIVFSTLGIVTSVVLNYNIFPQLGYDTQIGFLGGTILVVVSALLYYLLFTKDLESYRFKVFLFGKK